MQIKQDAGELIPLDISEWNDEQDAFITLTGFDVFLFNSCAMRYFAESSTPEERFNACFDAACLAIVDKSGNRLLCADDRDALRAANFKPFVRMFNAWSVLLNSNTEIISAKKN